MIIKCKKIGKRAKINKYFKESSKNEKPSIFLNKISRANYPIF